MFKVSLHFSTNDSAAQWLISFLRALVSPLNFSTSFTSRLYSSLVAPCVTTVLKAASYRYLDFGPVGSVRLYISGRLSFVPSNDITGGLTTPSNYLLEEAILDPLYWFNRAPATCRGLKLGKPGRWSGAPSIIGAKSFVGPSVPSFFPITAES